MINIKTMKNWNTFKKELEAEIKQINGFRWASIVRYGETCIGIEGGAVLIIWDFVDSIELEFKTKANKYSGGIMCISNLLEVERILNEYTEILKSEFNDSCIKCTDKGNLECSCCEHY